MKTLRETDAGAYITVKKAKIKQTVEVFPNIFVDVDRRNEVVGVEILSDEKIAKL